MKLSNLKPAKGSIRKSIRKGKGEGSGRGGTSTRGHKGAKSRSGYKTKLGFEGGQMPLQLRVPKYGFKNPNKIKYKVISLGYIQKISSDNKIEGKLELSKLIELKVVKKSDKIKILNNGKLENKLEIFAHKFSNSAKDAITKVGGKAIEL